MKPRLCLNDFQIFSAEKSTERGSKIADEFYERTRSRSDGEGDIYIYKITELQETTTSLRD